SAEDRSSSDRFRFYSHHRAVTSLRVGPESTSTADRVLDLSPHGSHYWDRLARNWDESGRLGLPPRATGIVGVGSYAFPSIGQTSRIILRPRVSPRSRDL